MGSEPEKKDKKPKLKATDIYYWACEFCAFECDKDTQLKTHIDIAHSEELWSFPCEHCEFKAQGPKYLREHILTCPHCPSNTTKDITEEKDKSIPNIQSIQTNTEEINIVIEAIEEEEPKSSKDDIVTEKETKSSKDDIVTEEETKLSKDNVVNEETSIAETKNSKKTEETNDLKCQSMLNFIEKSPSKVPPPKKIGLKRRRSKFELNETEDPDSGSTSSRSSVEEKKIAKKSSLKDKFDENEFSPEDSSSSEELSQLSNKNLDGHFSVSSEVSSEDENHVLIEKDLKVTLRGYKCSKCNTFKTTLRDAIEHHLCRNIIRSARM